MVHRVDDRLYSLPYITPSSDQRAYLSLKSRNPTVFHGPNYIIMHYDVNISVSGIRGPA